MTKKIRKFQSADAIMRQMFKLPTMRKMLRAQLAASTSAGYQFQSPANKVKSSLEVADEIIRQVGL